MSDNVVNLFGKRNQKDDVASVVSHLFSVDGDKVVIKDGVASRLVITTEDEGHYIPPETIVSDYETDIMTYDRTVVVEGLVGMLRDMNIDELFWMHVVSVSLYHHLFLRTVYIEQPANDPSLKMSLYKQPDGSVVLHTVSEYFKSLVFEFKKPDIQPV